MDNITSILITFIAASIVATIILNILFRKSIFMQIGIIWVINVFLTVINSKIHHIFPNTYTYPIALITGLSFTGFFLFVISKWVRNPLKALISDIQEISKGNLNTSNSISFNKNYRGEFKELKNCIKNLTDRFSFSISAISHSAETVNKMGKNSCNMASELSDDTSEQASSIQEISASMEEMNANINSTYANAIKTHQSTKLTNKVVTKNANTVNELNKAMCAIVSKIKVINEIATQTNLLALNASIEAKQAGEAGKGFSVVASEIKKLAEISKTAAEEISNITATNLSLSEQVNNQMKETIPYIDETLDLMHEITTASQELKSGSDQITSAMNNINHATQSKSIMSDELNKNSEKLENEANLLIDSISFFKL